MDEQRQQQQQQVLPLVDPSVLGFGHDDEDDDEDEGWGEPAHFDGTTNGNAQEHSAVEVVPGNGQPPPPHSHSHADAGHLQETVEEEKEDEDEEQRLKIVIDPLRLKRLRAVGEQGLEETVEEPTTEQKLLAAFARVPFGPVGVRTATTADGKRSRTLLMPDVSTSRRSRRPGRHRRRRLEENAAHTGDTLKSESSGSSGGSSSSSSSEDSGSESGGNSGSSSALTSEDEDEEDKSSGGARHGEMHNDGGRCRRKPAAASPSSTLSLSSPPSPVPQGPAASQRWHSIVQHLLSAREELQVIADVIAHVQLSSSSAALLPQAAGEGQQPQSWLRMINFSRPKVAGAELSADALSRLATKQHDLASLSRKLRATAATLEQQTAAQIPFDSSLVLLQRHWKVRRAKLPQRGAAGGGASALGGAAGAGAAEFVAEVVVPAFPSTPSTLPLPLPAAPQWTGAAPTAALAPVQVLLSRDVRSGRLCASPMPASSIHGHARAAAAAAAAVASSAAAAVMAGRRSGRSARTGAGVAIAALQVVVLTPHTFDAVESLLDPPLHWSPAHFSHSLAPSAPELLHGDGAVQGVAGPGAGQGGDDGDDGRGGNSGNGGVWEGHAVLRACQRNWFQCQVYCSVERECGVTLQRSAAATAPVSASARAPSATPAGRVAAAGTATTAGVGAAPLAPVHRVGEDYVSLSLSDVTSTAAASAAAAAAAAAAITSRQGIGADADQSCASNVQGHAEGGNEGASHLCIRLRPCPRAHTPPAEISSSHRRLPDPAGLTSAAANADANAAAAAVAGADAGELGEDGHRWSSHGSRLSSSTAARLLLEDVCLHGFRRSFAAAASAAAADGRWWVAAPESTRGAGGPGTGGRAAAAAGSSVGGGVSGSRGLVGGGLGGGGGGVAGAGAAVREVWGELGARGASGQQAARMRMRMGAVETLWCVAEHRGMRALVIQSIAPLARSCPHLTLLSHTTACPTVSAWTLSIRLPPTLLLLPPLALLHQRRSVGLYNAVSPASSGSTMDTKSAATMCFEAVVTLRGRELSMEVVYDESEGDTCGEGEDGGGGDVVSNSRSGARTAHVGGHTYHRSGHVGSSSDSGARATLGKEGSSSGGSALSRASTDAGSRRVISVIESSQLPAFVLQRVAALMLARLQQVLQSLPLVRCEARGQWALAMTRVQPLSPHPKGFGAGSSGSHNATDRWQECSRLALTAFPSLQANAVLWTLRGQPVPAGSCAPIGGSSRSKAYSHTGVQEFLGAVPLVTLLRRIVSWSL